MSRQPADRWFRVEIPSSTAALPWVSHGLRGFLRAVGWCRRDVFRLDLAVNEALDNAITHGNLNRVERVVRLEVRDEGDAVTVKIRDEGLGRPFDPDQLQPLSARNDALAERGRGVALMRSLMDEVRVTRESGSTVVCMKKYCHSERLRRAS